MLVLNLPAFESKKYAAYDCFHGNSLYGKILTQKGPITALQAHFFKKSPSRWTARFQHFALLQLPWVPEDIFFLSILMVRGEAGLMRKK